MIPSRRVFIGGVSGAGKSTAAYRHWLSKFLHVLYIDHTGEWGPHANVRSYGATQTIEAIRTLARRGGKWSIAAALDPDDDMAEVVDYLIPWPDVDRSPVRVLGGMAILNDEVDIAVPPGSMRLHNRTLYRRSRHVGLSVVSLTQRPNNVNKEVVDQAQEVLAMQLHAPAALAYMEEASFNRITPPLLQEWCRRHPHGGLYVNRGTGQAAALTNSGAWVAFPTPLGLAVREGPEVELGAQREAQGQEPEGRASSLSGDARVSGEDEAAEGEGLTE